ncbi:MAG: hypothetical protein F6K65_34855 [Moorea sp. SIO3C2]|nr:hypothetical protein [Moorena sp. SIO3C2]
MAANDRTPHYMKVDSDKYIELQLKKGIYDDGLAGALGLSTTAPSDETQIIGYGLEDAIDNGAVPLRLRYKRTRNDQGYATVFCSPEKLKDVRQTALKKKYNGKEVTKVSVPRKLCYRY